MSRCLTFVGWYGRQNAGDEAFKIVHEQLFPGVPKRWIADPQEAGNSDENLYILGGGDVFLKYYLDMIPPQAKFFAYGIGLGSPQQYASVLEEKDRLLGIWLRNPGDVEALRAQGVNAHYTPDIALLLGDAVRARPQHPIIGRTSRKRLVFCPSGNADQTALQRGDLADHFYYNYLKFALARALDELAKYYDIIMLPLSHDYKDMDLGFAGQVHGLMRRDGNVFPVTEELPPLDVARLIGDCQLCLSMKFHGLIFAALMAVPFVNIGLTRKTAMLCVDLEQPELSIPPYSFTQASLLEAVKIAEMPERRMKLERAVESQIAKAQEEAEAFQNEVLAALAGPPSGGS